jgi:uncharacterized protein (TIGR00730 family)
MIRALTVYCSSSSVIGRIHFDAAAELGRAIARNRWKLVYGGNAVGLMGHLANAVRAAGGKVIGITPQLLVDQGLADTRCDELVVTQGMRQRKALLEERGDAYIALPGGMGTLEEIFEIIVAKQLRYHTKPVILLNIDDYYRPLLKMIEHGIERRFIKPAACEAFFVADSVADALHHLRHYTPPAARPSQLLESAPSVAE